MITHDEYTLLLLRWSLEYMCDFEASANMNSGRVDVQKMWHWASIRAHVTVEDLTDVYGYKGID